MSKLKELTPTYYNGYIRLVLSDDEDELCVDFTKGEFNNLVNELIEIQNTMENIE